MSLSSPASWAAEMNFQSRYPGGIVVTMICLASLLPVCVLVSAVAFPAVMPVLSCPNDKVVIQTTPVTATATNKNAIRFMAPSLDARSDISSCRLLGSENAPTPRPRQPCDDQNVARLARPICRASVHQDADLTRKVGSFPFLADNG